MKMPFTFVSCIAQKTIFADVRVSQVTCTHVCVYTNTGTVLSRASLNFIYNMHIQCVEYRYTHADRQIKTEILSVAKTYLCGWVQKLYHLGVRGCSHFTMSSAWLYLYRIDCVICGLCFKKRVTFAVYSIIRCCKVTPVKCFPAYRWILLFVI